MLVLIIGKAISLIISIIGTYNPWFCFFGIGKILVSSDWRNRLDLTRWRGQVASWVEAAAGGGHAIDVDWGRSRSLWHHWIYTCGQKVETEIDLDKLCSESGQCSGCAQLYLLEIENHLSHPPPTCYTSARDGKCYHQWGYIQLRTDFYINNKDSGMHDFRSVQKSILIDDPWRTSYPETTVGVSLGAIHDSAERYPPPNCHPDTRNAVRQIILEWVYNESLALAASFFWL